MQGVQEGEESEEGKVGELTKEGSAWALSAAADACESLSDAGLSLRALGAVPPPRESPGVLGAELRAVSLRLHAAQSCNIEVNGTGGRVSDIPCGAQAAEPQPRQPKRKPRTFNPITVAVGQTASREEAQKLLGDIAPHFAQCNERVRGFLRGVRDKMMDPEWSPSDKQIKWLRSLAAGGWSEQRRF